jgi:hypothetical protein
MSTQKRRHSTTGTKLCPHILLEGTRLTFKTELAFALNEHPRITGARRYRYHNPVVSGEWCGFTNHPWGRGLINFDPDREEDLALETFAAWLRLFELLKYYSWIIDRFHLSTRMHQYLHHGWDYDLGWVDRGLAKLGFRLVLCTRDPGSFAAARRRRLRVSGNPRQYDDLEAFVEEQKLLRRFAKQSRLPTLELDMSDNDVTRAADEVATWLERTGGLYQR